MTRKARKFPMFFLGGLTIQFVRFLWGFSSSQSNISSVLVNRSSKSISMPTDALKVRRVFSHCSAITMALLFCGSPQIASLVIEGVVIPVVCNLSVSYCQPQDESMHVNSFLGGIDTPNCIKTTSTSIPVSAPLPLVEPFEIGCINDGSLTLRKRNFTVRWIGGHPQNLLLGGFGRMVAHPMPYYTSPSVSPHRGVSS